MFFGNLHLPASYEALIRDESFRTAFSWIRSMPDDQAPGIYELQGKEIYVNVHGYDTLPAAQCRFESHRDYLDIQYCIEGGERIEIEWASRLTPDGPFDADKDLQFYTVDESSAGYTSLLMRPGDFAIFYPEDAHRPRVQDGHHPSVRKLVVKIRLGS